MSNVQEIIKSFELYVDDSTELSTQEEIDLFNKVYADVWTASVWELAKDSFSGSINGTTIDLPTDFMYVLENAKYTDVSQNNYIRNSAPKIIWVDNQYFTLVNWSDRKQHQNGNYCWIDLKSNKLEFNRSVNGTVEYDYYTAPATLGLSDSPIFPAMYHNMFYHAMAVDDYAIQQFDKAKSYAPENQAKYQYWLEKMQIWNMSLLNN